MDSISDFATLNGVVLVKVIEDLITLQSYENKSIVPYVGSDELPIIDDLLKELKGGRACIISSDVFNIFNKKIKLKSLDKHVLKRALDLVFKGSLQFIAKVSKDEDSSIIFHISYSKSDPALTVLVGLENDAQVILLDIHYERNERRIVC